MSEKTSKQEAFPPISASKNTPSKRNKSPKKRTKNNNNNNNATKKDTVVTAFNQLSPEDIPVLTTSIDDIVVVDKIKEEPTPQTTEESNILPEKSDETKNTQEDIEEQKHIIESLKEQYTTQITSLQDRCSQYEKSISLLQEQSSQKESQLQELNTQLQESYNQIKKQYDDEIKSRTRLEDQLQLQSNNIVQLAEEHKLVTKELEQAKKQVQIHERDLEMKTQQISDACQEKANETIIQMGEKYANDLDKHIVEKSKLRNQNKELNEEMVDLRAKCEKLEKKIAFLKQIQEKQKDVVEKQQVVEQVVKEEVVVIVEEEPIGVVPSVTEPLRKPNPRYFYQKQSLPTLFIRGFMYKRMPILLH